MLQQTNHLTNSPNYQYASEVSLTTCRKNVFAFVALFVLILITYSNTFDASWHFDDEKNILENSSLHLTELNPTQINKALHAEPINHHRLYRPVACLSFALNYYFGKTNVFGYHLVNLIVHFLAAYFLYLFIQNTLNLSTLKAKYGRNSYFIALLATVLWAINPVQTQAITYIVQRMASMAGMFYIATMYFYLKGRTTTTIRSKRFHYIICVISGALAIGAKENAIMLPFILLLFDLFVIQGISKKSLKKSLIVLVGITCACLIIALLLRGPSILHIQDLSSVDPKRGFSLGQRLLTEPRVILLYLSLIFYPMPDRLCLLHDIPISTGLLAPLSTLFAAVILLCIIILSITGARRWPFISFCILFFFINHLIEGGIIPLELAFEHRNYIPSMLLFVPISIVLAKALAVFSHRTSMKILISSFITVVIIAFGHSTFFRNAVWADDEALWLDAIEKNPNIPRPYHNLGRYYFKTGQKEIAFEYYRHSLALPEGLNTKVHHLTLNNMGEYFLSKNDYELAKTYFLEATKLQPKFPQPYLGLAMLSSRQGLNNKALDYVNKALYYDENLWPAIHFKGVVLLRQNRAYDAVEAFKQAHEMNPNDVKTLNYLGVAYKLCDQFGNAFRWFEKALSINHQYIPARLHLIEIHFKMGHKEQAKRIASKLIDFFPGKKFKFLIDRIAAKYQPHSNILDLHIVYAVLGEAAKKRGDQYRDQFMRLSNRIEKLKLERNQEKQ